MKPDSWAAGATASATALHNRATQIREPGVYIGFLEWIIWGLANKMTVLMLFGDAIQDIIDMFAPHRGTRRLAGGLGSSTRGSCSMHPWGRGAGRLRSASAGEPLHDWFHGPAQANEGAPTCLGYY